MGARFKIEDLPPHLQEMARAQLEGKPSPGVKTPKEVWSLLTQGGSPKKPGKPVRVAVLDEEPMPAAKGKGKHHPYRSGLEREFHEHLKRCGYPYCEYEPMSLKLADGARYTPDFVTRDEDGRVKCWETKGFWREAARVRIKVAARLFPWMRFVAVTKARKKDGGGWQVEEF